MLKLPSGIWRIQSVSKGLGKIERAVLEACIAWAEECDDHLFHWERKAAEAPCIFSMFGLGTRRFQKGKIFKFDIAHAVRTRGWDMSRGEWRGFMRKFSLKLRTESLLKKKIGVDLSTPESRHEKRFVTKNSYRTDSIGRAFRSLIRKGYLEEIPGWKRWLRINDKCRV